MLLATANFPSISSTLAAAIQPAALRGLDSIKLYNNVRAFLKSLISVSVLMMLEFNSVKYPLVSIFFCPLTD